MWLEFLSVLGFSFAITTVFTPLTIFAARKFNLVDDPKKRKHPAIIHKIPIPRAGGIPIFLGILFSTLLFLEIDKQILGIIAGGAILVILGTLDDKYDLSPYLRFLVNILVALIVVGVGIGISFITNPLGGIIKLDTLIFSFDFLGLHSFMVLADIFAIFWIVWVINMLNWSKGVDGQMPGIAAISFFVLFALSLRFLPTDPSQAKVAKLALIGAGASLGFLIFNFHPAKIFPGYGATILGFLIAVLAILSQAKVGAALLVMAVPASDAIFTVARRTASGSSPFWGDRAHLHHKLLDLDLGQRQIAFTYWTVCAILGSLALLLRSTQKVFAVVLVAALFLGGLIWINIILKKENS